MGMMNDTITVYNKYLASNVERWKRTVLSGVYWNAVHGAVLRKTGAASADSVVVIVPRSLPGYVNGMPCPIKAAPGPSRRATRSLRAASRLRSPEAPPRN